MPDLVPCASCEALVFAGTCSCPHCGAAKACHGPRLSRAAVVLGLVGLAGGCYGRVQADYTAAVGDDDRDGWYEGEDCDDGDPAVHPEAEETPGDGIDSNCDGDDDT